MSQQFSEFADSWWNLNGPVKPLHVINKPRCEFISKYVDLKNKNILDLGCGAGILSESLSKSGANVTGVDSSVELILAAKQHLSDRLKIDYIASSFEQYGANVAHHNKFDIITCMELLEHVADPDLLISHCNKLLKPGGKLFLSTLNRTIKSYALGIVAAEYVLNLVPKGTHQYGKFIKPSELKSWLEIQAFNLKYISGIKYNPLTNTAGLMQDVSVNYIVYASKPSDNSHATKC